MTNGDFDSKREPVRLQLVVEVTVPTDYVDWFEDACRGAIKQIVDKANDARLDGLDMPGELCSYGVWTLND